MDNLHHHQPLLPPPPANNIHGHTTHSNLRLRDAHDAHVLFQAVREGHFQLIRRRLNGPEQQRLSPGHVYVWADREGALERWTDGHNWSPSRVRGAFLMYDEMPEPPEASFLRRKKPTAAPGEKVKHPRKKRLPPLPGGLSKQTYSATLMDHGQPVQKWHLTAYFTDSAVTSLPTIEEDPLLRAIIVPESTFVGSMSGRRKSKSKGQQRGVSESNLESAHASLDNSPVQEYSTHTSFPIDPPSHSSSHWIATAEPKEYSYDDDDRSGGSGSGGSAGTIREEHGDPSGFRRRDSFTSPVSPIFDQPPPPPPSTLSMPMGPPHSTSLSGWTYPPLPHFSQSGTNEERRGSLSAQSNASSTSTSTSLSADSSHPYASSASSTSPNPPSHSSVESWATQYSMTGPTPTSSTFPWVEAAASKPHSGFTASPTPLHNNHPFPTDNSVSPPQNIGTHSSHTIPPHLQITHANPPLSNTTPRQANFSGHPSDVGSYSIAAASVQPNGNYYTPQHQSLQYSDQTRSGNLSYRQSASVSSQIPSGQDAFTFSTTSEQPLHSQNFRQRASTISTMSNQHQASSSAPWPSPVPTSNQPGSADYTQWAQNSSPADLFRNPTDLSQQPFHFSPPAQTPATMNIPPPHRHSLSSFGPTSTFNASPQYSGRPTDVFESVPHPQTAGMTEAHSRPEGLSQRQHRQHHWGPT